PLHFPGFSVQGDNGIAEQIVARAIAAIEVGSRFADRKIEDAPLFVDGQSERPDVVAGAVFPTVVQPRFVAWLTRSRYRVELPYLLTGSSIVSMGIAALTAGLIERRIDMPLARPVEIGSQQDG